MELNREACLWERLDHMDSGQLNRLLQLELGKETRQIDQDLVCRILGLLENREAAQEFADDEAVQAAVEKYRAGCKHPAGRKKPKRWFWHMAAVAAMIMVLVMTVPRASGENLFVEFITNITQDVIAFFCPGQANNQMALEYRTDHPGLQQVYDTMTELGVTAPVVPSWIPEEYELTELETASVPAKTRVYARLEKDGKAIVLSYELYGIAATHEYLKGETLVGKYERAGVTHDIYENNEKYLVYWKQENVECFIVVGCQEDSLIRILDSIYMMEEQ